MFYGWNKPNTGQCNVCQASLISCYFDSLVQINGELNLNILDILATTMTEKKVKDNGNYGN